MRFLESPLPGAWLIEPERIEDQRGWFARTFDESEFRTRGMNPAVLQCSASFNSRAGTLRGLHYQAPPHGESKLVRCVRGAVFDVAADLRPGSATHGRWHGVELSERNGAAFYIPAGMAHGFQTLEDDTEVHYMMGDEYVPDAARGVRWDDPLLAIAWPDPPAAGRVISQRDLDLPALGT